MIEYQASVIGLRMTVNIKMPHIKVFGDFKLVIKKIISLYNVKKL